MSGRGGGQGYRGRGGPRGGGPGGGGGGGAPRGGGAGGRGGGGQYRGGFDGGPRGGVYSSSLGPINPDPNVTKTEDALLAGKDKLSLAKLQLSDKFPTRPGFGTKGQSVTLWANYVTLDASPQLVLYRYAIIVSPAAVGRKLNQINRLLLESSELAGIKNDSVTDFKSTLISKQKINDQTITIPYRSEGEDEPTAKATTYRVEVKFTNTLAVGELVQYLTSTDLSAKYDEKLPMIQALNIFLDHYAKSTGQLAKIGASKTFSLGSNSDTWDLGSGLTAIRGFFASVRAATARVLVNVNVSHGAFYQHGPLERLVMAFGNMGLLKLSNFLKRLRITTTHLKEKRNRRGEVILRVKTILSLANKDDGRNLAHPPKVRTWGAGPKDVEFWMESASTSAAAGTSSPSTGKKGAKKAKPVAGAAGASGAAGAGRYISVYDFFVNAYGIRIENPNNPVINVGTRDNPTYLPMQVCRVIPGQPASTKLDPRQTQNMIRFAVRPPGDNAKSIVTKGLPTAGLAKNTNALLSKFGIAVGNELITVNGRVLAGPNVLYRQNMKAQMMAGGWNMVPRNSASLKFHAPVALRKWSCLYIVMPGLYHDAWTFTQDSLKTLVRGFYSVLNDTGIATSPPLEPLQRVELQDTDDPKLDSFIQRAAASLDLLFIILPAGPIPLYNRIKQLADVKYGIHTVCCVGKKIAKPQGQDQYFRNEALKINLKLGGNNQIVEPMRNDLIQDDKTMVVGIDVTHPSPGSASLAPSVAGMVANVDKWMGQWPSVLSIQPKRRQEMVGDLKTMLESRLRLWKTKGKHANLPENILVYRDGVSEGQYQLVLEEELPLLRDACKGLYPAAQQAKGLPRFTVVIVGKRHHTRFYPTTEAGADRSGNTKPGTVVDRGITEARHWDFFLQAHTALQGTARPAHYYVVLDEIFRQRHSKSADKSAAADELQALTQNMCYVFGRATKAVSICTPAYYADILCERARCYLSHLFESPTNSATPSLASGVGGNLPSDGDLHIHEKLKDTMFYI